MASPVGSLWSHALSADVAHYKGLQLPVCRLLSQEVLPDDLELSQLRITSGHHGEQRPRREFYIVFI